MATDLATLAIKVENGDVIKATTSLNTMAVAGGKTEAATQRLTRRMALLELEARQMDTALAKSTTTMGRVAASMGLTEATTTRLTAAFAGLGALAAVGFIGRKTLEETEAAQAAMAQLEAAVASTGGVAGRTVAQLDALSLALQKTTTFSDEAVKGAEAMLLTFDKIRGAEFDRATAAVTDLAARMGGDLSAAAVQVGKALQDPTTGLTALRRSGVSFSAAQIEVIRKLYETGRAAEGQRVILAELEHQFGGSAAAARDTLGGALTGLKNAFGDLFEVSRGASQGTVTAINAITAALEGSGLSMNKVLKDATVDWETMRASIEKVKSIMALQIGPGFLEQARNIINRIDFDLSAKIADLNAPAKAGPASKPPPKITIDVDTKQATKDLDAIQKATDKYYNTLNQRQIDALNAANASREQNDQLRALITAYGEGQAAVERVTIAQAGENAVKELGAGVSAKVAASVRREAEEHERLAISLGKVKDAQADRARDAERAADEAMREMERRAKDLHRTVSNTIEGILTDIDNRRNPFVAIFENLKRGAIKAVSDILATKIEGKVADILGIETPASKQEKAAREMKEAAATQLRAAEIMSGRTATGGFAGATGGAQQTAMAKYLQQALKIGGAGYGGYQAGYGIGAATGDKVTGALGGAASGAWLGNKLLPGGIGAAVGGIAGFVGGIIGAGDAARAARERMLELKAAFALTFDSLKAELSKDTLGQAVAQVKAAYQSATKQFKETFTGEALAGLIFGDRGKWEDYKKTLGDLSEMEKARIAQLEREADVLRRRTLEDFEARRDAATPGNEAQEALAAITRQLDREREDLITSFGDEIDAREAAILAMADQAFAAEKEKAAREAATGALNAFSTAVRNAPTGFKLEPYIQEFAKGRPYPGQFQVPTSPFVPPMSPLSPSSPQVSRTGTVGATAPMSITIAPGAIVVNESKTPQLTATAVTRMVLTKLDEERNARDGLSGSRSAALERLKLPPGGIPWRS